MVQGAKTLYGSTTDGLKMKTKTNEGITDLAIDNVDYNY